MLVGSDILIRFSRRDQQAAAWLDAAEQIAELNISVITKLELFVGCRDKRHLNDTKKFLSRYQVIEIDAIVSQRAVTLIEKYTLSHGLQIADALIAATALATGLDLATINRKDFRFIDGLRLVAYP